MAAKTYWTHFTSSPHLRTNGQLHLPGTCPEWALEKKACHQALYKVLSPQSLVVASQPWGRYCCYSHFTEVDTQTRGGEGHTVTRGKAGIPIHVSGLRSSHQHCQSQPSLMSSPSFLPCSRAFCYTTAQKFWSSNLQGSCVCPPHPLNQELLKGTARF